LIEFSLSAFMDDDAQEKNASLSSVATFQCPRWRKPMVVDPDLQAKTRRSWRGIIVQASSSTVQGDRGTSTDESLDAAVKAVEFTGVHHVGLLCENTERSLEFYCGLLGLSTCTIPLSSICQCF
jgi:hypothetical protein